MSTFTPTVVARRLTPDRLGSYVAASTDLSAALTLYDWNAAISGAFHEDLGRIEVVFRNALDAALVEHGRRQAWPEVWFRRHQLFPGRPSQRSRRDIADARARARQRGLTEPHGKVIAELNFGFWRYLCSRQYLTSLWVPALAVAFPDHPRARDPRAVREDVEDHMQRLHFLRNRIAHHEPVHQRDLGRDHRCLVELASWICPQTTAWIVGASRCRAVMAQRP